MPSESVVGFELSSQQKFVWDEIQKGTPRFVSCRIVIRGALDKARLTASVEAVLSRHESLRTRFSAVPGLRYPVQVIPEGPVTLAEMRDGQEDGLASAIVDGTEQEPELQLRAPALSMDVRSFHNVFDEICSAYSRGGELLLHGDEALLQY